MMNSLRIYMFLLHGFLKLAGMRPQAVQIEPGTLMHFWVPTQPTTKSNNKPAVLFLHGFAFNGILTWQFQVLSLARNYAVYVPDFLFFGGSNTDKTWRSPAFQAECVAKSLMKLGVDKCSLVCFSYGGMVGFKMAEMYPDLVKSVVVTGSVIALTESISSGTLKRIEFSSWSQFLIPRTVRAAKEMLDIASYKFPWLPNFVFKDILKVLSDHRKERFELLEAMVTKDKDFSIPRFSQKIHLLWGENDRIFNMEVVHNFIEQLNGKATLHIIKKAGHLVQIERPFAYNMQLNRILSSICED